MRFFLQSIKYLIITSLCLNWGWMNDIQAAPIHNQSKQINAKQLNQAKPINKIIKVDTTVKSNIKSNPVKINQVKAKEVIKKDNVISKIIVNLNKNNKNEIANKSKVTAKEKTNKVKIIVKENKETQSKIKEKNNRALIARHRSKNNIVNNVIHREAPSEPNENLGYVPLRISAGRAIIIRENTGEILFAKNVDTVSPIASVTKLMTAMVVIDRNLPMDEEIIINDSDVDRVKYSSSRLLVGTVLTRREALHLALMSSENRAAASLARTYPGGTAAFVNAMNRKAHDLGMNNSYFADPTGLNPANVSTAADLVKMAQAARRYETIHEMTTTASYEIGVGASQRPTLFINTNRLVRSGTWDVGLSKTGYINEAGHCLVMQTQINDSPIILVLLNNFGKYSCQADAARIRQWLQRRNFE